jgi:hypothetical protein
MNLKPKVLPFNGNFINEPTESSLIGEKLPNLVTLPVGEKNLASWNKLICPSDPQISHDRRRKDYFFLITLEKIMTLKIKYEYSFFG